MSIGGGVGVGVVTGAMIRSPLFPSLLRFSLSLASVSSCSSQGTKHLASFYTNLTSLFAQIQFER